MERAVSDGDGRAVEHEQPACVASREGRLRDELGRKVEVVVGSQDAVHSVLK